MTPILVPTRSAEDWKSLLAQPDLHWKAGNSAMALAHSWESAGSLGFPPEVGAMLATSGRAGWNELRLLLGIPEFQVPLPGGSRASQTDLMTICRSPTGVVVMAVEGKVDESLGPTVGEKRTESSDGVQARLSFLLQLLELSECPDGIRYQLLHRTASALLVARDFAAEAAVMLVHSFSPTAKWFEDFAAFGRLLGQDVVKGRLTSVGPKSGTALWIGWCTGDQRFLR